MLSSHKVIMIEFIQIYKSMSFLWDKTHPNYQNRLLRMKGYKKLLEKYKEIDDEATLPILKAKLDNMRASYIRELKKVRANNSDGSGRKYSPCLWYYDRFTFLENHVLQPKTQAVDRPDSDTSVTRTEFVFFDECEEDNQSNQEYAEMPVEYLEDMEDNSDSGGERPPLRHRVKQEPADPVQAASRDWEVIGRAIGVQLRDVAPHQAAVAQKLIADALFRAKLGRLTDDSAIS